MKVLFISLGLLFAVGCTASMFMRGGMLVNEGYTPGKVLAKYNTVGESAGVEYWLIETKKGKRAIYERYNDGRGALFQTYWRGADGDHYASWVATGAAFEIVISQDLSANGKKFIYNNKYYWIKRIDEVRRPVPCEYVDGKQEPLPASKKVEPVASLVPYK
jgi:hypothetical protein